MGTTFKQPGDVMELVAPGGGVTVDTPVLIGSVFVIPQVTAAVGVSFNGFVVGVHVLSTPSAPAWSAGPCGIRMPRSFFRRSLT